VGRHAIVIGDRVDGQGAVGKRGAVQVITAREHLLTRETHKMGRIGWVMVFLGAHESCSDNVTKVDGICCEFSSDWDEETSWEKRANEGCDGPTS